MDSHEKEILFATLSSLARVALHKGKPDKLDSMMLDMFGNKCAEIATKYQLKHLKEELSDEN